MKVVILCGGLGTRLREETEFRPKPMVEVGGRPILWHIMKIYAHHGFREFVLCLGYRGNMIKEYFLNYEAMNNDFTICLGQTSHIRYHDRHTRAGLQRHAGRHRPGHDDRRPPRAHAQRYLGRRHVPADLRRRRERRRYPRPARLPPESRQDRHGDHRAAGLALRRARRRSAATGSSSFAEKPQRDGWIERRLLRLSTAKSSTTSDGDDCILEREPLERLAADGQLMAYRHDGLLLRHGHATANTSTSTSCGPAARRPGRCGHDVASFWRDRPVLVTGATGLVGGWLARRLRGRRRRRRLAWCATGCRRASWSRSRTARAGQGGARRRRATAALLERALGEYEIDTVFHLAAQTIVGSRQPQPALDLRDATSRAPGPCSRPAAARPTGASDRRRLVRQGLRRPGRRCRTTRTRRCRAATRTTSASPARTCIAQTYAAHLRPAGGDHALRQLLRRRRPELEPHRARHDPLACCAASARSSAPTASSCATTSTSRTARRPTCSWPSGCTRRPELRGQAFNFSNEMQVTVLELSVDLAHGVGAQPGVPNDASMRSGDSTAQRTDAQLPPLIRSKAPRAHAGLACARSLGLPGRWSAAGIDAQALMTRRHPRWYVGSSHAIEATCMSRMTGSRTLRRRFLSWSASTTRSRLRRATPFVPAESPFPSSGRSSTPTRCSYLVDASLDFWLTTGRFADAFERDFARWLGRARTRARQLRLVGQPAGALRADLAASSASAASRRATKSSPSPRASRPRSTRSCRTASCPVFVDVTVPTYNVDVDAARSRAVARARAPS